MILLTSTSDKIQLISSSAANLDVHASFGDLTTSSITPGRKNTAISSATTTDIVDPPAASTQRQIKTILVRNRHAATSDDVTLQHTDGSTVSQLVKIALAAGETLQFVDGQGFTVFDSNGGVKTVQSIGNDSVDNTKLADMAPGTIKGRSSGTGNPEDLSAAQVLAILGFNAPVEVAAVSLSGTSTNLATGIPSWANEILVTLDEGSTNGTSNHMIQLGTASGFETSGYTGSASRVVDAAATTSTLNAGGIRLTDSNTAAAKTSGVLTLRRHGSSGNVWIASGTFARDNAAGTFDAAGRITLPGALTQIRWTTNGGADTADSGSGAVKYKQ